jgi:hypothetical protein
VKTLSLFLILLSMAAAEASELSTRIETLFLNAPKQRLSAQVQNVAQLSEDLLKASSADYRQALLVLERVWSQNPDLAQATLLQFQTDWEHQFSNRYWREMRLQKTSKRFQPLIFMTHVLDQNVRDSKVHSEYRLRLAKEMYGNQNPTQTLPFPAPISILAHTDAISRLTPISLEELLTEEQMQQTQSALEALGVTGAAGLFLIKNKTQIQGAARAASKNPLKITPVGLILTGVIIGASEGLYSWMNHQSLRSLEVEITDALGPLKKSQGTSTSAAQDIQLLAFETAIKNYALKLTLPIFSQNQENEISMHEGFARADVLNDSRLEFSDLKIRYSEAILNGDSDTQTELSELNDPQFQNWRHYIEGLLFRQVFNQQWSTEPLDEATVTKMFWTEQLEAEQLYLLALEDHHWNQLERLEAKMSKRLRNATYKTLFSRRNLKCSFEHYRNAWAEQLANTGSADATLESLLKYYYGSYPEPKNPDPLEIFLSTQLTAVYDPGTFALNQSIPLGENLAKSNLDIRAVTQTSLLTTKAEWQQGFLGETYCGHPNALLEQAVDFLKTHYPAAAAGHIQRLKSYGLGLESLLHL